MKNLEWKELSKNWLDLGCVDEKLFFFEDDMIPERYIKEMQHGFFLNLNQSIYHFKDLRQKKYFIRELLGEEVSLSLSIPTVQSVLAKLKVHNQEKYGLLSLWARNPRIGYFSLEKFQKELNDPENPLKILNLLEKNYPNSLVNIEFRDLLARDYFTHELDRKENEITFLSKNGETHLAYLCDYEFEFYKITKAVGVEKYYHLDLLNEKTKKRVLEDERLMDSFRKVLKLDLKNLLEKLKEEKALHITSREIEDILDFQTESKSDIKRTLNL